MVTEAATCRRVGQRHPSLGKCQSGMGQPYRHVAQPDAVLGDVSVQLQGVHLKAGASVNGVEVAQGGIKPVARDVL